MCLLASLEALYLVDGLICQYKYTLASGETNTARGVQEKLKEQNEPSTCGDPRRKAPSEPRRADPDIPSIVLALIPLLSVSLQPQLPEGEREDQQESFSVLTGVTYSASGQGLREESPSHCKRKSRF